MATESKVFIQVDNERIELTGEAKEQFLAERKAEADAKESLEAARTALEAKKREVLTKLGLTAEEVTALLA
jgi:hypothetical protein